MGQEKALHLGPVLQWTPNWYKGTKVVLALNKGAWSSLQVCRGPSHPGCYDCLHPWCFSPGTIDPPCHTASSILISSWSATLNRASTETAAPSSVPASRGLRAQSLAHITFSIPRHQTQRRERDGQVMRAVSTDWPCKASPFHPRNITMGRHCLHLTDEKREAREGSIITQEILTRSTLEG